MNRNIIVIGASAGGVQAVTQLLSSLSADIPAAFFVTLHIAPHNVSVIPQLIARRGVLSAEHPRDGAPIRPGRVYVAPPDYHLLLEESVVRLSHGPKENRHRPAIDPMFRSAAKMHGQKVAGVLLTGNLDDGVAGMCEIQHHKGLTIVQDPDEAPFPEMPRNALLTLEPDHCLLLRQIESLIATLPTSSARGTKMKATEHAKSPWKNPSKAVAVPPTEESPIAFVCPECQGPIWEIRDGKLRRYQCLVGHRYSLESLIAAHGEELEAALWFALRALEERINLQRRLAKESDLAGRKGGRQLFQARVKENERHARILRGVLEAVKNSGFSPANSPQAPHDLKPD